jgi:pyruvate dehydrogenase E2 component (dihydrolipoamide acetyltransferase)
MSGNGASEPGRKRPPDELVAELEQLGIPAGSYRFEPLDLMRKAIARRMTESFRDVPHFALLAKIEVDALLAVRGRLNAQSEDRVSVNDLLIKAAALALKASPAANASYTAGGALYHDHADIAVAVALEGGLVTPIIRRSETKSVIEISREMKDLAARGRAKRLAPSEYVGGTFSISNLGMFGVSSFGSILNPPQGCILSIGRAEKQLRFTDDTQRVASVIEATLTCDHRVVDGATGARWLDCFQGFVEAPDAWLQGELMLAAASQAGPIGH